MAAVSQTLGRDGWPECTTRLQYEIKWTFRFCKLRLRIVSRDTEYGGRGWCWLWRAVGGVMCCRAGGRLKIMERATETEAWLHSPGNAAVEWKITYLMTAVLKRFTTIKFIWSIEIMMCIISSLRVHAQIRAYQLPHFVSCWWNDIHAEFYMTTLGNSPVYKLVTIWEIL